MFDPARILQQRTMARSRILSQKAGFIFLFLTIVFVTILFPIGASASDNESPVNGCLDAKTPLTSYLPPGSLQPCLTAAVTLSSFSAKSLESGQGPSPAALGRVLLEWTTGTEVLTAGFNLYRSESAAGPYTRINPQLVPATNSISGGAYQYEDATTLSGKTYYYQLEDVELNGKSTRHDPIRINLPGVFGSDSLPLMVAVGLVAFALIASGLVIVLKKANAK